MASHPLAKEATDLLETLYGEVAETQLRLQLDRIRILVLNLAEIIGNLNQIALDAFEKETHNCEHCGHDHDEGVHG